MDKKHTFNKKFLTIYPIILVVAMLFVFPLATSFLGKTLGYIIAYCIYLILLIIGVVFAGINNKSKLIICHKKPYYILAFIPVIITFFVAFLPTVKNLNIAILLIVAAYAIMNGILEELFWRLSFNNQFGNNIVFAYIYPTVIFLCWHFALIFAKGMEYTGGPLALVGGAMFMGALWGLVVYKTKNIYVTIIAHVLTNFFAFSQLIYQNWFI